MNDQRDTHIFQANRPHVATYTPARTLRDDILDAWFKCGVVTQINNPSAWKLAAYMLNYGEPTHAGWMVITLTDAEVRVACGFGERSPWKALTYLVKLGIVVPNDAIKGSRVYRLLPSPDWPIPATDEQLALDFGRPSPGADVAAKGRVDPRQGEGRRDFSNPRDRADGGPVSGPDPRGRAGDDPRDRADGAPVSGSDPRERADGRPFVGVNPRERAGDDPRVRADERVLLGVVPRERADESPPSARSRGLAAKKQQQLSARAAAAAGLDDCAREDLASAVVEAGIADPLASRVLAEPGMTAAVLRDETGKGLRAGKGPALIGTNAITRVRSEEARRKRRLDLARQVESRQLEARTTATSDLHATRSSWAAVDAALDALDPVAFQDLASRTLLRQPTAVQTTWLRLGPERARGWRVAMFNALERDRTGVDDTGPITDAAATGHSLPSRC